MAERYSRILSAATLYPQLKNYLNYIQTMDDRNPNVGQGRPRPASQVLFIRPFNYNLPVGQMHKTSGAQPTFNSYSSEGQIGSRVTSVTPTGDGNVVDLDNFKPARVIITTGRSTTGTVKTSRITKAKYLSYGGTSTSLPFGKANDTDTYADAVAAIRTTLLGDENIQGRLTPNDRVAFQEEKLSA